MSIIPGWLVRAYEIFDRWTTPLQPGDVHAPGIPFEPGAIGSYRRDPITGDWRKYEFDPTPLDPQRWTPLPNGIPSDADRSVLDRLEREILERSAQRQKDLEDAIKKALPLTGDLEKSLVDQQCNRDYNAARNWFPRRDPLTLDLDGDGLETVGIDPNAPILFDHDGDGISNATGWIQPDDGFLVFDRNGDGRINDGTELFGDSSPLYGANGEVIGKAADGFAALAQEDSNGDGVVNAQDANWAHLRVWQDLNSDGISQADELKSLESLGIAGLIVAKSENTTILANGNQIADLGHFIKSDGSEGTLGNVTGAMADIDLADNPFYRSFGDTIASTPDTASLPDMQGSGALRDLREASSLSPELASALAGYAGADTKAGGSALGNTITGNSGNNVLSGSVTMAGGAGNALGCVRVRKAWRRMNLREKMSLGPRGIYARSYRKYSKWMNASWVVLDVDLGERS